jgi:polar amino acid transport system permease protein
MHVIYEGRTLLLLGTIETVKVFLLAAGIALVCAVAAGLARLSPRWVIRAAATCYIELFRGTSLVVQLFWLFFALPFLGIQLGVLEAATLGLGLCFGAYGAEVVRGAILAVPRGQFEAADALNMSRGQRMRRVVLPQALLIMLPSAGNLLVLLLKSTAAASLITLPELTFQGYALNVRTFATVEIFTAVLLIYFALALLVSRTIRALERWLGTWRRRPAVAA